jgi:phage terminase large subunit-like protein
MPVEENNLSLAAQLAALPEDELEDYLSSLTDDEAAALEYDWEFLARPNQIAPDGEWSGWLVLAGRGFGKTRTGAEWVRQIKDTIPRIGMIAPTAADVRDVMVEGESGIMAISPPWDKPLYEPSKRRLTWDNGAQAALYSADEPERLRGPQHGALWADEIAAWRYPETWDMAQMGLRLGTHPRFIVTTTPKPIKIVRELLSDPSVIVTRGTTYDNQANLAPSFLSTIVKKYEGTRLGRQELNAEVLEDTPGALWNRTQIDKLRVNVMPTDLERIVVSIDPAVTSGENADETGITAQGIKGDHVFVLDDKSGRYQPDEWARKAIDLYDTLKADAIIAEANNGGDMVKHTIRIVDQNVRVILVHASRGKVTRAEPISALYEQGRVHHVGSFPTLEDQMCGFTTDFDRKLMGYSPDRLDALVWGISQLIPAESTTGMLEYLRAQARNQKEIPEK